MSINLQNFDASSAADAAAGVLLSLPFRREKDADWGNEPAMKKAKICHTDPPVTNAAPTTPMVEESSASRTLRAPVTSLHAKHPVCAAVASAVPTVTTTAGRKARDPAVKRQTRLEQNRRAAKESRHRKNNMIEELQRSVIFFSRANTTLEQQNEELSRLVAEAKRHVPFEEGAGDANEVKECKTDKSRAERPVKTEIECDQVESDEKETARVLALLNETPTRKAESVEAPVPDGSTPTRETAAAAFDADAPSMQPGSTMQAMASFQQAASAAMQEAMKGLQNNMGGNMMLMPVPSPATLAVGANAQQAYTDTMTAIAMQQAAAAAVAASAGQHQAFMMSSLPFMMGPMFAWQLHQQQHLQMMQQHHQQQQQLQQQQQSKNENSSK